MKKKVSLLIIMFVMLLTGCSKQNPELVYDKYKVKYDQVEYSAYVDSKIVKQYTIDDRSTLKVSTGDYVEENQILFNIKNPEALAENIKYNNQVNNINADITKYTNRLNEINNKIKEVDNNLSKCNNDEDKNTYNLEKQSLESSKQEIEDSIVELQRNLNDLNVDIQYSDNKENETALFKGQVVIDQGILNLYSKDMQIVYNATQDQINDFSYDKNYEIILNNENIGTAKMKYVIPNDENTTKGINSYYKIVFEIETEKELLRNTVVKIINVSQDIYIPKEYVKEIDKKFYVKKKGKEIKVELEKENSQYKVISGVNINDILESYIGTEK